MEVDHACSALLLLRLGFEGLSGLWVARPCRCDVPTPTCCFGCFENNFPEPNQEPSTLPLRRRRRLTKSLSRSQAMSQAPWPLAACGAGRSLHSLDASEEPFIAGLRRSLP